MRVSIPRETLEKIKNDYGVSEEKATRLYLSAFDEAEAFFWGAIEERMNEEGLNSSKSTAINLLTPREVKAYLDKYVIGQEEYKKRIAIASAFHFAMVDHMRENMDHGLKRFRKKNTLIAGPSGSGKTYCIEVLGDLLEVPTLIVDATDYTEAGYVGKSADDMIRELIDMAPGSTRQDQAGFISRHGGIIFIDELDKKAREGSIGHDISREGFQRAILKMIERKFISIENPMSPSAQIQDLMERQKGGKRKQESMISTENILFIMGGSFQRPQDSLEQIIRKRLSRKAGAMDDFGNLVISGFQAEGEKKESQGYKNLQKNAEEEDYIHFGIIPELVGRTPIRSYVNALSKNDLVRIMNDTEDSLLKQYQLEFEAFKIDLQFADDAIEYVAEKAEKNKTGARALIGVWEDILTDFQYELPGTSHHHLLIDRTVCMAPKDYLLKILSRSPFEDFCEMFHTEHGIRLEFTQDAEEYVHRYATNGHIQVSEALKILLTGASALNYMGYSGVFEVSKEMLEDPRYFDNLYVDWHEQQLTKGNTPKAAPSKRN
ncbi:AAA domain-containing protein [bacterium]|jgi:ATP-dependent Clp protease ATP-binding subunit ClpX|nr:AAA domain-containing protein [bacterium]